MNELKKLILQSRFYKEIVRESKSVEITSTTLKDALKEASIKLNCDIYDLNYKILEEGSSGIFGVGSKPYRVLVTQKEIPRNDDALIESYDENTNDIDIDNLSPKEPKNIDGQAIVKVTRNGIMLSIFSPKGNGKKIKDIKDVEEVLFKRSIVDFPREDVLNLIDKANGEMIKIGVWIPDPKKDGRVNIITSEDSMNAFAKIIPPIKDGREVDGQDIVDGLEMQAVKFGIKHERIQNMVKNNIVNEEYLVAEGQDPVNGENAKINYKVDMDKKAIPKNVSSKSKVDFRELNLIENVVAGQVLAEKIELTDGTNGRDIFAKIIEAKNGNDVSLKDIVGRNVSLSQNDNIIIADINGQVVRAFSKIAVESVYTINGDVGAETGNIDFLGNVLIKGSVADTFEVKAAGNIEVQGSVGKAKLEAGGDIVIKLGVHGHDSGYIRAGNDLFAKFIQYANIDAGRDVIIAEDVINSNIDAERSVAVVGKRAVISGGNIRAFESVEAKVLGSSSSARTVIEVGVPPNIRKSIKEVNEEKERLIEEKHESHMNLKTLEGRASREKLDDESAESLEKYREREYEITTRLEEIAVENAKLKEELLKNDIAGKISAAKLVNVGVKIIIRDAELDARDTFRAVTFFEENETIQIKEYEKNK